jgi:uncharacterized protein (UPF0332 family)
MNNEINVYREKAKESLHGAQSELVNRRFNNCADRSYYACFQAAIYVLLKHNLVHMQEKWQHSFVKGQFVLQLINRRKKYPERFRSTLERCYDRRQTADYYRIHVTETEARRSFSAASDFFRELTGEEVKPHE